MSQDTRKDPRAKVLTMTVRYKSATLDEFIEHHSYDVSRGGMFIKTPSPFPPGTLLKFEVKIAADQKVIQGVGRVVWKRDSETQPDVRPAGSGPRRPTRPRRATAAKKFGFVGMGPLRFSARFGSRVRDRLA